MSTQRPSSPKSRAPKRGLKIVLWVLQVLLAVFFAVASAFPKLTGHPSADPTFDAIGYGDWFMYLVGALELAGAIALLIPLLSGVAALAFIALMVGAFVYEVTVIGSGFWYTPVILVAAFTFIAWGRWDRTMALFTLVTGQDRASTA